MLCIFSGSCFAILGIIKPRRSELELQIQVTLMSASRESSALRRIAAIQELFSVMFSNYELFGSGFLPLLALNEGMINDLSSTNQGRRPGPNGM
jgi:hypothetical protein